MKIPLLKIRSRRRDEALRKVVEGSVVLITGASSGIGRATALRVGALGATVLLVARRGRLLEEVKLQIEASGGRAYIYEADLTDAKTSANLIQRVHADHGGVDILVNNAGVSIRRPVRESFDRFGDFERTMRVNYFGPLRLILGFAPAMFERGSGHIINVSTLGVQTRAPNFSAYVASKAALDAFTQCMSLEYPYRGVRYTTVHMGLVRTALTAPTKIYEVMPALTLERAVDFICNAIIRGRSKVALKFATFIEVLFAISPRLVIWAYHRFHDPLMIMFERKADSRVRSDDSRAEKKGHEPSRH
jgi:NAD(P)-dependent dehydrogenase (short-subunit alcohol dehydrogenase family)